ncbi:CLUMA_CG015951, isoform A [Clunio marinus]|uniref:CLUMA_CG015951, isoform A n=1 Tax=Clunio marinus TaxID=568069 RepID=A0A1J1IRE7_9DIPT|nr:CLUMA_CG015951, isoform A [Clunio marinus]
MSVLKLIVHIYFWFFSVHVTALCVMGDHKYYPSFAGRLCLGSFTGSFFKRYEEDLSYCPRWLPDKRSVGCERSQQERLINLNGRIAFNIEYIPPKWINTSRPIAHSKQFV